MKISNLCYFVACCYLLIAFIFICLKFINVLTIAYISFSVIFGFMSGIIEGNTNFHNYKKLKGGLK